MICKPEINILHQRKTLFVFNFIVLSLSLSHLFLSIYPQPLYILILHCRDVFFVLFIFLARSFFLLYDGQYFRYKSSACQSAIHIHRASTYLPALIYFCINLFLFYLPTEIPAVAGCAVAASRRVASTVNRKPCGIAAILSRMRVSTCTRRSYARRSKYGNAFTRNVFTGLSRNTKSTREPSLTVYKQADRSRW